MREFLGIILFAANSMRLWLFCFGVALYSISTQVFGLTIATDNRIGWPLILGLMVVFGGALLFSIELETSMRRRISELATRKFFSSDDQLLSLGLESVHYTGAIEKFVWAAADLIKAISVTLVGLILSLTSSFVSATAATIGFSVVILALLLTLDRVSVVRARISTASKNLILKIETLSSSSSGLDCPVEYKNELTALGTTRVEMLYYRTLYKTIAAVFSISLGAAGLWLHSTGDKLGIAIVLGSLFSASQVTKISDSIVVAVGELIHLKEFGGGEK